MISADPVHDIHVAQAADGARATLRIPAGFARHLVTASYCRGAVVAAGVAMTADVTAAIDRLLASLPPIGSEVEAVIARRVDAVHGQAGAVEWMDSDDATTSSPEPAAPAADTSEVKQATASFDYYSCSAYTMVKAGDIVGSIIAAGAGEDGQDLAGRAIKARPGKPAKLDLNETILCDAQGRLIAQIDGVLRRNHSHAKIDPVLEIQGYVDFSTGNVDFEGDVVVRKGVRACFTVRALGNVDVHGLIEATTIQCGGTLTSRGGIAGHERARVLTGKNLVARYLDNVVGQITGDLHVEREAINCDILVGGSTKMPHASLIGGRLNVTGDAEIGTIGSNAGVMPQVIFGSVPLLEAKRRELDDVVSKVTQQQQALRQELQFLEGQKRSLSAQQKERMTEVLYEMQQADESIAKALANRKEIDEAINQSRSVRFTVLRKIHEGTRITIRGEQYRIDKDTAGPLCIGLNAAREPVFAVSGGSPLPLCQIAPPMPRG